MKLKLDRDMTQDIKTMISNYSSRLINEYHITDYNNYELQMICYYDCIRDLYEYIQFEHVQLCNATEIDGYFYSVLRDVKAHHYKL